MRKRALVYKVLWVFKVLKVFSGRWGTVNV